MNHITAEENNPADSRDSFWILFRNNEGLVKRKGEEIGIPRKSELCGLNLTGINHHCLARRKGIAYYTADLGENRPTPSGMEFRGMRELIRLLPEDLFRIVSQAYQILNWEKNHSYCGKCGHRTEDKTDERAKICPSCGLASFPLISPAIIVAVRKNNEILLVRSHRHPEGLYSVVAGYVEPSETLEECVEREIKEETGIFVKNIRYFGSQFWPFPHSLMIAFTADFEGGKLVIEENEIAAAGWFKADGLPRIPEKYTIARQLIDDFIQNTI